MRFHTVSLPHTKTTQAYSWCAYTQKVRRFATMMHRLGHEVLLYAADLNDAECTELIPCSLLNVNDPLNIPTFHESNPTFYRFNNRVVRRIAERIHPRDFLCLIGGRAQQAIANAFLGHMAVEIGVGYSGVFSNYKVFESYAWMHVVYGALAHEPHFALGNFYDAVIPSGFELEEFPYEQPDDYYLYLGRVIPNKGCWLAAEVCAKLGKRLIVAGAAIPGQTPPVCEYVGVVDPVQRGKLMSKALATFVPTLYLEPFGNVHVESMLCGTPVITTDWGVFSETVVSGENGFRCRSFSEFCEAARRAPSLDRAEIRRCAQRRYSTDVVGPMYDRYFNQLTTLWNDGFYTM
jgi:glycosyltransferase involved in cell wall biosynthesis